MKISGRVIVCCACLMPAACVPQWGSPSIGARYYEALGSARAPVEEDLIKGEDVFWRRLTFSPDGKTTKTIQISESALMRAARRHPDLARRAEAYQAAFKQGYTAGTVDGELNTAQGTTRSHWPAAPAAGQLVAGGEKTWQSGWHWGYVYGYQAAQQHIGPTY